VAFSRQLRLWRIDPCGGWFGGRRGRLVDKARGVLVERAVEGELASRVNGVDLAVMHLIRGHQADPGMVMVLVVPVEEPATKAPGILDAAMHHFEAYFSDNLKLALAVYRDARLEVTERGVTLMPSRPPVAPKQIATR